MYHSLLQANISIVHITAIAPVRDAEHSQVSIEKPDIVSKYTLTLTEEPNTRTFIGVIIRHGGLQRGRDTLV